MRDRYELGTTVPHEEQCSQVGAPNFSITSRMEARALISQLRRLHGPEPEGAVLKLISCPHDFGTYYDVAVEYQDDSEEAEAYMLKIDGGVPDTWDEQARKELEAQDYFSKMKEDQRAAI